MKKHLIAAAVAAAVAAPAMAQDVQVYGRFDQSYNHTKTQTGAEQATKATTTGLDGGVGGSRLGFRGTEDLGGGLKAGFVFEFGVDPGENQGVASTRLGFAEISGGFGTFRMGRQVSPTKAIADAYNALGNNTNFTPGDANGSGIGNVDVRVSNAITYLTPNFNGLTAQIQYSNSVTETATKTSDTLLNGPAGANGIATSVTPTITPASGTATSSAVQGTYRLNGDNGQLTGFGLNYSAGKLAIGFGMLDQSIYAAGVKTTQDRWNLGATYDFGAAKLHLERIESDGTTAGVKNRDRAVTVVGLTVPLGSVILVGQYFDGSRKAVDTSAADYSGYKLRATYTLSKRTGLYAQLGETETKVKSSGVKTTLDGYGLGVYHTF